MLEQLVVPVDVALQPGFGVGERPAADRNRYFRVGLVTIGTVSSKKGMSVRLFRKKGTTTAGRSEVYEIGILFDIDACGPMYGPRAYKILFNSLDPQRLRGCSFHDGDTKATLAGVANLYCIVIQSSDPLKIDYVRDALSARTDDGLLTVERRFIEGGITIREPLVPAGYVDAVGNLVQLEEDMIPEQWTEGTVWKVVTSHI